MPGIDQIAETDRHASEIAASMGLTGSLLDYKGVTVPSGPDQTQTELVPLNPVERDTAPISSGGGTANDLIDNAITARQNFESQRQGLIDQLGTVSNGRQALQIRARLHGIDQAEHGLDWEVEHRMRAAKDYNDQVNKEITLDRRATIDEHGAYLMSAISNLDTLLHRGVIDRDAYSDGILKAMQRYPMGIENPAAAKHLDYTVKRADRLDDFQQRLDMRNAAKSTMKMSEKVAEDLMNKTGLSGEEFAAIPSSAVRAGKFVDAQGTEVQMGHVGGTFTNDYTGAEKGPVVEIDTDTGPLHMTRAAYDRYRRVFGTSEPEQATAAVPPVQPDTVRVKHPDGQVGTIPAGQLKDALSQGYTQVQ